ncbi:ABC transporter ATP-binding protein [Actinopolymorpha sp. B17G11]|uniref:ABC transporter ATP-binding protein n=1 Tax=Actinopolymorpha sp. B17G11 TaxID=3160861 RepID=UPI0032E391AB
MTRPFAVTGEVVTFCAQLVAVVGLVGVMSAVHPALLVVIACSVAVTAVAQARVSKNVYATDLQNSRSFREMYYRRHLMTNEAAIKELQGLGAAHHMRRQHTDLQRWYEASLAAVYRKGQGEALVAGAISALLLTVAYWFVARQGLAGTLTAGDLFLVLGAFTSVGAIVSGLSGSLVALQGHAPYLRDYFDFLDLRQRLPVRPDPIPLPATVARTDEATQPSPAQPGLTLKNVTFTYPTATRPALRGIDLEIAPGEMVALVGDNGAGKTTLVKLLLRHYDPQDGQVLVGGVDLRDADPTELQSRFGVLFQDFVHYNLTVRENLQLGRVERKASDSELWTALHAARADFVQDLTMGLDATVGKGYEWCQDISGGQWQRLSLARLMYRNADVWILDEPTSALDPEAEVEVFTQLRENLSGRIGIIISHRFSTVRIADRILVMQDGQITEAGTHEELLDLGGRYAHLFDLQAAGYR